MVQILTTTLSSEELFSIIEGAVNKALASLPDAPGSRPSPITRKELIARLQITDATVTRWERKGLIPCMRIGSAARYDWEAVLKAIEAKKTRGGQKK